MMEGVGAHRPRNLNWQRAAALLYGDWGTSKAYVIGLAFITAAYSSLPIIIAVCILTALVGYNYIVICKHFPEGGGVYSAARIQSPFLAVLGALLLVANFTVTAALSGWAAMSYFRISKEWIALATACLILLTGVINSFGAKHSGSFAVTLALPMALVVLIIIVLSLPHLSLHNLEPSHTSLKQNWIAFVGVILALSGVEAIANLTGVMRLDPGSSVEKPRIGGTAAKAILPVAIEVVFGTVLLGWAVLSLDKKLGPVLNSRWEDILSVLGEQYAAMAFGPSVGAMFGIVVAAVVGMLLLSAVNTAIAALIGLIYMMARDGEMPKSLTRLNNYGVPFLPLVIATTAPIIVVVFTSRLESLAGLYAIGVVGAITVNLGACFFNQHLKLAWHERAVMGFTFVVLFTVEVTLAKTKPDALFFAVCVLGIGFGFRTYSQRRAGFRTLTVSHEVAAHVAPEMAPNFQFNYQDGQKILVAARGMTPVLRFGLEEAHLRKGMLYVLYVREVAVTYPGYSQPPEKVRWQDDPNAAKIMYAMMEEGKHQGVTVIPLYASSDNPASTILDLAATLGIDMLMLGSSHRKAMVSLLKGNVVAEVARNLPDSIQLVIHS
jgi:amino acid transporter/nucleotide-binding universal stress UspA family protein